MISVPVKRPKYELFSQEDDLAFKKEQYKLTGKA
jgi:hypothetical protein